MGLLYDAFTGPIEWQMFKNHVAGWSGDMDAWIRRVDDASTGQVWLRPHLGDHHSTGALDTTRAFMARRAFC